MNRDLLRDLGQKRNQDDRHQDDRHRDDRHQDDRDGRDGRDDVPDDRDGVPDDLGRDIGLETSQDVGQNTGSGNGQDAGRGSRGSSPPGLRPDLYAAGAAVLLFAAAALVGTSIENTNGTLHVGWAPLYAYWSPHVGPGTPAAITVAVAVVAYGPPLAARLPWRALSR